MKVRELIEQLQKQDPEAIVVLQRDSEGNGFSPLSGLYFGAYEAETTWSGNFGPHELTESMVKAGYSEEDVVHGVSAVALHPIN